MKGKLDKNILRHIVLKRSSIHLRFGCRLGCAPVVETRVPWSAGAARSVEGSPPKALAPAAAGLSN